MGTNRQTPVGGYAGLSRLSEIPESALIRAVPGTLQRDIKSFFGTYAKACGLADELLFQAGNPDLVDAACKRSAIGKLLPDSLYVHRESLDHLEPLLRVYEGCAVRDLGEIEEANVIKLHRMSGKLSYLSYPDFESDPHPALVRSVKLCMRTRQLDCQGFGQGGNPPCSTARKLFCTPTIRYEQNSSD